MDNVVKLSVYRKKQRQVQRLQSQPQSRPQNTRPVLNGMQYYCLRCDNDTFRMYLSGNVHCTGCGAFMRNLTVQQETP